MNELDCLNDILYLREFAGNFDFEFLFMRDFAEFAGVRIRAVKWPPSADNLTVRQARIVVADMSRVELLQGLLKDG